MLSTPANASSDEPVEKMIETFKSAYQTKSHKKADKPSSIAKKRYARHGHIPLNAGVIRISDKQLHDCNIVMSVFVDKIDNPGRVLDVSHVGILILAHFRRSLENVNDVFAVDDVAISFQKGFFAILVLAYLDDLFHDQAKVVTIGKSLSIGI